MEFPVRCFTCGTVIGHLHEKYDAAVKEGKDPEAVFKDLSVRRYCCRRMFVSHVDLSGTVSKYRRV